MYSGEDEVEYREVERIEDNVADSRRAEDMNGEEGRIEERMDCTSGGEVAAAAAAGTSTTAFVPCSLLTCFFRSKLRQNPFPQRSHSNGYK